ncbi:MAG: hypothetical protein ACTTHM_04380 [Peptoanaerobacter stomatis]|uniref:hypothetical protein n=1 Tax=Peptoanaerobacter stomatis TaxID=796937 RepID=UPI003F9FA88B
MAGNIKGITIEINGDTTRLDRALRNVNNTGRDLNNQLKDIDKSLQFNPGNTELLSQKQRVLAESVENTKNKLNTLKEAQEQAKRALADGKIGQDEYDALTREIFKAENQLKSFEQQQRQMNSTLLQMGEKIGNFGEKAGDMGKKLAPISTAATAGLAGLTGLAVQAGKTADDINTLSKVTGVSVESLQKFKMAEDVIDVSTETMAKSLAKLTKSMDGANKGAKNQVQAFQDLGVSFKDAQGNFRDNEDVFNDVINALSKIPNETERDAIAFQLFGKSAQELNPLILGGADALKEIGDRAQEAGLIMSQEALDNINAFNDELDTTKAVVTQAGLQLGASVGQVMLPMLQSLAGGIQALATNLSQMDPATVKIMLGVLAVVASIAPLLITVGKMATGISTLITLFGAGGAGATALSSAMTVLTGPIGVVIALITALGVAFVVAYKNNEEFRNKVQEAWKQVQEFIGKAIESIKKLIEGFVKLAKDL